MHKQENSIETSMADTVASSHIREIVGDITEVAIDSFVQGEFLKAIPIVSTFVNATHATIAIRDRLFINKVVRFLFRLEEVSAKERKKYVEKLSGSPQQKRKYGETIIMLLERLDRLEKADIVGSIHKRQITGEFDDKVSEILCSIVDRLYLPYIYNLIDQLNVSSNEEITVFNRSYEQMPEEIKSHFVSIGLFNLTAKQYSKKSRQVPKFDALRGRIETIDLEPEPSKFLPFLVKLIIDDDLFFDNPR